MGFPHASARGHLELRAPRGDRRGDALVVEVRRLGAVVGAEEVLGEGAVRVLHGDGGVVVRTAQRVASQRRFRGDERILDEGHLVHGHLLELLVVVRVDERALHLVRGEVIVPDAVPAGAEVVEVDEGVGASRDEGVEAEGLLEIVVPRLQRAGFVRDRTVRRRRLEHGELILEAGAAHGGQGRGGHADAAAEVLGLFLDCRFFAFFAASFRGFAMGADLHK